MFYLSLDLYLCLPNLLEYIPWHPLANPRALSEENSTFGSRDERISSWKKHETWTRIKGRGRHAAMINTNVSIRA